MKSIHFGWNSGEFGPEFWGRSDIERYALGAATIKNLQISYSGAASTGPRTRFVEFAQHPNNTVRFFSFEFSNSIDNAYLVVFSAGKIRFVRDGAYILEASKAVSAVANGLVSSTAHGYAVGDLIYVTGHPGILTVNTVSVDSWYATDIDGAATSFNLGATQSFRVFTLTQPYADADLSRLTTYQVFDQIKFSHPGYPRYLLTRTTDSWTFTPETITGGEPLSIVVTGTDTGSFIKSVRITAAGSGYTDATILTVADDNGSGAKLTPVVQSGALVGVTIVEGGRNYTSPTITANVGTDATFSADLSPRTAEYVVGVSAVIGGAESGIARPVVLTGRANFTTTQGSATYSWPAVSGAESYNVYRSRVFPEVGQANIGAELFYIGNVRGTTFTDNNVQADTTKTPRFFFDPFAAGAITYVQVTAAGSGYNAASTITVNDATGSGFIGYPIVSGGAVIGVYIAHPGRGYTAPTFSISAGAGATLVPTLSAATGLEPAVSFVFQQRAGYAGSNREPLKIIASKIEEFGNFSRTTVISADDPYNYTIDSPKITQIRHVLPIQQGLLVFTRDNVALLRADEGRAVTPLNGILDPQSYLGASIVPPVFIGEDIVYVEEKNRGIRLFTYNPVSRKLEGQEISFFSRHLFRGKIVTAMAGTYGTDNRLYLAYSDGSACVATVQREQQTFAFTRFTTRGRFEAVAALNVGTEEHVYFSVRRGNRRVIEYIRPNETQEPEDLILVDGAISTEKVRPAAALTLSGDVATASAPVFSLADVGKIIAASGMLALVTEMLSATQVRFSVIRPANIFEPETTSPARAVNGQWWLNPRLSAVTGVPYEGQAVTVVGDGKLLAGATVSNGVVTLSEPCAIVHVGFGAEAQLTTLTPVDVDGEGINVHGAAIYYRAGSVFTYGMDGEAYELSLRHDEVLSAANDLRREGEDYVVVTGGWSRTGKMTITVPPGTYAEILRITLFYEKNDDDRSSRR